MSPRDALTVFLAIIPGASLIMLCPPNAAAATDAKAARLMAELRAASGGPSLGRHAAFHEAGTVVRDGKTGTYEVYADLHSLRYAATHVLDGTPGGSGFDGRLVWRLGPDGKVTTSTDPKAIAEMKAGAYFTAGAMNRPEEFPATFRYVGRRRYKAKAYDVVSVTPDFGGSGCFWLDLKTRHLRRVTVSDGKDAASVDIWDDRVVDGTVVGFKNDQVEGRHRMTQTLTTYEYVPLDPTRFAPPP